MPERYSLAIVGSGPAGLAAAVQAAARGTSHILLERGQLANTLHRYRKHKHVMAEPTRTALHPELDVAFTAGSREQVLAELWAAVERNGVNLAQGPEYELVGIDGERGDFTLRLVGAAPIRAEQVLIAIGTAGSARHFGVPGEGLPHVHYLIEDPAQCAERRCVVVGAGDSGVEEALALLAHDADVTLVNRGHGYPRAKARNRAAIETAVLSGQIREYSYTTVQRFEPGGVWLRTQERDPKSGEPLADAHEFWVSAHVVVGCLGATRPQRFLESLGIDFSGGRDPAPLLSEACESSRAGVYLAGELTGKSLIKRCLNQGYEIVEQLLGYPVASRELPLLRELLAPIGADTEEALERIHKQIRLFQCLSPSQLEVLLVESRIHRVPKGQVIYRSGEFSETLFAVLSGSVQLSSGEPSDPLHPLPELRLGPGDFFGAASVLSGRPRSATARALEDSLLIESPGGEVRRLMRVDPSFSHLVSEAYALAVLQKLFPQLIPQEVRQLAHRALFETHASGELILREGDEADGLHVLLRGAAAVMRNRAGRAHVINHVRAGEYVGEIALVRPMQTRSASVKATVACETLRIPTDVLEALCERYPEIHEPFEACWQSRIASDERVLDTDRLDVVDFLIAEGGKEATDLLVIDETLCIRCDNCERACAETHRGVSRLDREAGRRFAGVHLPTACQHCENPLCMTDCPPNALQRHPNGEVYILDSCIGCGNCASDCPYDVIKMEQPPSARPASLLWSLLFGPRERARAKSASPAAPGAGVRELAVKCDLCREVPGVSSGARAVACVSSCPTGAIIRRSPDEFVAEMLENPR